MNNKCIKEEKKCATVTLGICIKSSRLDKAVVIKFDTGKGKN